MGAPAVYSDAAAPANGTNRISNVLKRFFGEESSQAAKDSSVIRRPSVAAASVSGRMAGVGSAEAAGKSNARVPRSSVFGAEARWRAGERLGSSGTLEPEPQMLGKGLEGGKRKLRLGIRRAGGPGGSRGRTRHGTGRSMRGFWLHSRFRGEVDHGRFAFGRDRGCNFVRCDSGGVRGSGRLRVCGHRGVLQS